jgi:hypothetical protein
VYTGDEMPELATIERLLKERDAKLELIDLLKAGQTQKVINLLERDVKTINESIQAK